MCYSADWLPPLDWVESQTSGGTVTGRTGFFPLSQSLLRERFLSPVFSALEWQTTTKKPLVSVTLGRRGMRISPFVTYKLSIS